MEDYSKMLQDLLQTEEGQQGFAQVMSMLNNGGSGESEDQENSSDEDGGDTSSDSSILGDLPFDPSMLFGIQNLLSSMPKEDTNTNFLVSLKPLLREEKQKKVDEAVKMMKLFSMIPILKQSGLLSQLMPDI